MRRIVFILFVLTLVSACSARVEYVQSTVPVAADAVNINTASPEELERLPHVGRKTAEAIIKFRTENGPFRRVEHLMLIRGFSERRMSEIRPFLKTE